MKAERVPHRTIWRTDDGDAVEIVDQTLLPHRLVTRRLETLEDAVRAIRDMQVRGAPLIGATAAYGLCLALRSGQDDGVLAKGLERLRDTRPTGRDLFRALEVMEDVLRSCPVAERRQRAWSTADAMAEQDVDACRNIGQHGARLIRERARDGKPVNVLTHCNAGWLACVGGGTALAPVYSAHEAGVPVHVWVGETRPRNQGSGLTAWELRARGVPHTLTVDSTAGHLMQTGKVDLCLVGADRVLVDGTVCNKIGTYPKALAARDNGVPFYVAIPGSTVDWDSLPDPSSVPVEERSGEEVLQMAGDDPDGVRRQIEVAPEGTPAFNPAFDVTPPRLVTGLVTERGIADASRRGLAGLFPERGAPVE